MPIEAVFNPGIFFFVVGKTGRLGVSPRDFLETHSGFKQRPDLGIKLAIAFVTHDHLIVGIEKH